MQIETERLILREFREDDCRAMSAYWENPLYQRYNPEVDDAGAVARHLCRTFIATQSDEPRRKWQLAVTLKDSGDLIGNCGIRVNAPEHCEANIGYELNPDDWGQGFATEAATAIIRFGFEDLGLHRIWAECNAENAGSIRVLTKLGMQREARFREHQWFRNRWWDTEIYAILDCEWDK
ncbi:GNAT family protein [soil metagenome]